MIHNEIYYLCPDRDKPCGGIKELYQHVDILNRNGYSAFILHGRRKFRCTWFQKDTPVRSIKDVVLQPSTYVLIPQSFTATYKSGSNRKRASAFWAVLRSPAQKVIFNQGVYATFKKHSLSDSIADSLYCHEGIRYVMAVSQDSKEYIEYVCPHLSVHRVHISINGDLFFYDQKEKKKQLCYMPGKNDYDLIQIINILRSKKVVDDFKLVPIVNMSEEEVASVFRESLFFICVPYQEGAYLPAAEAMASGCLPVGYHGMGPREYFFDDMCFPVEAGNTCKVAKTLNHVLGEVNKQLDVFAERAKKASNFIHQHYSPQVQEKDILKFWEAVFDEKKLA